MLSISSNRNKLSKLNGSTLDMLHQDLYMEGHAMGTVKGYKVAGIYQSQDQISKLNEQAMDKGYDFYQDGAAVGDYMYVDTNGDGYISEDGQTPCHIRISRSLCSSSISLVVMPTTARCRNQPVEPSV